MSSKYFMQGYLHKEAAESDNYPSMAIGGAAGAAALPAASYIQYLRDYLIMKERIKNAPVKTVRQMEALKRPGDVGLIGGKHDKLLTESGLLTRGSVLSGSPLAHAYAVGGANKGVRVYHGGSNYPGGFYEEFGDTPRAAALAKTIQAKKNGAKRSFNVIYKSHLKKFERQKLDKMEYLGDHVGRKGIERGLSKNVQIQDPGKLNILMGPTKKYTPAELAHFKKQLQTHIGVNYGATKGVRNVLQRLTVPRLRTKRSDKPIKVCSPNSHVCTTLPASALESVGKAPMGSSSTALGTELLTNPDLKIKAISGAGGKKRLNKLLGSNLRGRTLGSLLATTALGGAGYALGHKANSLKNESDA